MVGCVHERPLRRRHRPGDHLLALHRLRRRWRDRRHGAEEHRQIFPRPGWVEHDATEIWANVEEVVGRRVGQGARRAVPDLAAVGITNQRETTVVWERATGRPIAGAIVWQDTRTDRLVAELGGDVGQDRFRAASGLPLATYFSGPKVRWLLDETPGARAAAPSAASCCSAPSTRWLIWKLTGRHVTDVTNASRSMLMNLATLDWDDDLLAAIGVPRTMLPEIRPSSEVYGRGARRAGRCAGRLGPRRPAGRPVRPDLLLARRGQVHLRHRQLPLLVNTGERAGRVGQRPAYHRRRSRSAGQAARSMRWRAPSRSPARWYSGCATTSKPDRRPRPRSSRWPGSVADNGGCYFVPAFAGLFAPHWRSDTRERDRPG